jgi:dihydroorotase
MNLVIKKANIVTPAGLIKGSDILIQKGLIKKIAKEIDTKGFSSIDASGKYVFPGFIDMHTHLRVPGREDKETLVTGSASAVKGGFTTVMCMPNTNPAIDNYETALWIREESEKLGLLDIFPVGAVTKARQGKELSEFMQLKKAGCLALSDDGDPIESSLMLRKALEYAKFTGLLIISHPEDKSLSAKGILRESEFTAQRGIPHIPEIAETVAVAREIELARFLGVSLHLAHISSKRSAELIKRAKQDKIKITAETCPHYFSLSLNDIIKNPDSRYKINPPLGREEDKESLKQALSDGTIDCISTDHAPHTFLEKKASTLYEAEFGVIGLELALSLGLNLVREKRLSLELLSQKMSTRAAEILSLPDRGRIQEGLRADLTIVDKDKEWQVTEENIVSKSKNTPFIGKSLKGVVEYTIYKGNIVYKQDKKKQK